MKFKSLMIFAVFVAFSFLVVLQPAFAGEPVVDESVSTQVDADATVVAEVFSVDEVVFAKADKGFVIDPTEYVTPIGITLSYSSQPPDLIQINSAGKENIISDKRASFKPERSGPLIC